jgi:GTPase SAR1 family protein
MAITPDTQQVTSIGHTFICYARHDSSFVIELAMGLRSRGVPIWIDQWDIGPGADWSASIDAALNESGSVLIVLSPEAVASNEVRTELRAALNSGKRIVPLLHRPCEIPRQLLLTQYLDWSGSTAVSAASLDELAEFLRTAKASRQPQSPDPLDRPGRRTLLEDVRGEARDRLQSLGTDTPIPLLLERQPHQVARPWDGELVASAPGRPAAHAIDIFEVFDDAAVDGQLLILGAPGSGKTTVLLQLLQGLAGRAAPDTDQPIPVLLSLATWKNEKPLDQWLVDELHAKYGVRRDVGGRWRDARLISPLFDGLDEIPPDYQSACVEAINAFYTAYKPRHLVVCCRQAEYEQLPVRLRLREAVCLQPLEAEQIRMYLDRAGGSNLWNVIEHDPDLREMARSPLLLSFIRSVSNEPETAPASGGPSARDRRRQLFDTYLSACLSVRLGRPAPPQAMRSLRNLAAILSRKGDSEFLIERMQPDWLVSPAERWSYRAGVFAVTAAAVFLAQQALLALFGLVPPGNVLLTLQRTQGWQATTGGSPIGRMLPVLLPIVIGTVIALRARIVPVETLTWSWSRAARNTQQWARAAAVAGLDYGFTIGAAFGLVWYLATFQAGGPGASVWHRAGQIAGCAGGVFAALLLLRVRPTAWLSVFRRTRSTADALIVAAVYALVSGWTLTWIGGLLSAVAVFVLTGLGIASQDRYRLVLLRWPLAAAVIGALVAALSWPALSPTVPLLIWTSTSVSGALGVGMIAAVVRTVFRLSADWLRPARTNMSVEPNRAWKRLAITAVLIGLAIGLAALVTARTTSDQPLRNVVIFVWFMQVAFVLALGIVIYGAVGLAVAGGFMAGLLGALAGTLSGATGADVERRLRPNQGIRQSALNVLVFSALGVLIVGLLYGPLNVSAAAVWARTLPTGGDLLRFGVGAGATMGILAGLLPGAACIQHFVLRFVLSASGTLPLRFVRFLQFATERRLLQRVGGRYRFIHVTLRDHLAAARPAPVL